jgi:hypothetical protein
MLISLVMAIASPMAFILRSACVKSNAGHAPVWLAALKRLVAC